MSEQENTNDINELLNYIPIPWKSGDVVTSEKLNKIEGGIASAQTIIVPISSREIQFDGTSTMTILSIQYTANDLVNAFIHGINIIVYLQGKGSNSYLRLTSIGQYTGEGIMFACLSPEPRDLNPVVYWFAPSEADILMLYTQQTSHYVDQFYGRSVTPPDQG